MRIRRSLFLIAALAGLSLATSVHGHGGVVEEDDVCVIKVNYLRAHFKVYQPRTRGHEQFCEDLPDAAESVFVMEYMHDALPEMPIEFRIIRDVTGKGRFARMEDVENIADLDAATVFYREPMLEPDVYTISHTFAEEGDFIGIVSARNPDSDVVYASVFPFEVGFTGLGYWPFLIGLLMLLQLQYLFMSGRLKRWFGTASAVVALLLVAPVADAQQFTVSYSTPGGPVEINRMHSWILHVEDESGEPVEGAEIEVEGGMPAHDHGLPTAPRVTEELGNGDYRLDGVRFHMRGLWQMYFTIRSEGSEETVVISLEL
jgi:hypothetical protein